jgi:hypothetical protein
VITARLIATTAIRKIPLNSSLAISCRILDVYYGIVKVVGKLERGFARVLFGRATNALFAPCLAKWGLWPETGLYAPRSRALAEVSHAAETLVRYGQLDSSFRLPL